MRHLPLGKRRYLSAKLYRTGVYVQLRWGYRWHHLKLGCWLQRGLRLSTRRQELAGRSMRYATLARLQLSYWGSSKGHSRKPMYCGLGVYWGKGKASGP